MRAKQDFRTYSCVYHDSSTKGFKHGIKHKRHDCWRGDIRTYQCIDGEFVQISRMRKRFKSKQDAQQWVKQNKGLH